MSNTPNLRMLVDAFEFVKQIIGCDILPILCLSAVIFYFDGWQAEELF